MSYFVTKGNRCKTCSGETSPVQYSSGAVSGSSHASSLAQLTLQQNELGTKRGSGGNSYSGYLRRKLGSARCCP